MCGRGRRESRVRFCFLFFFFSFDLVENLLNLFIFIDVSPLFTHTHAEREQRENEGTMKKIDIMKCTRCIDKSKENLKNGDDVLKKSRDTRIRINTCQSMVQGHLLNLLACTSA